METVSLGIIGGRITPKISMPVSATILDVKQEIKLLMDVDVERQTLRFNNQVLMNEKTILDYGFKSFAGLVLDIAPLPGNLKVVVKFCSKKANFEMKETALVAELRAEIGKYWHIPTNNTILHLGSVELEDGVALSACNLCEGSEIDVEVIRLH